MRFRLPAVSSGTSLADFTPGQTAKCLSQGRALHKAMTAQALQRDLRSAPKSLAQRAALAVHGEARQLTEKFEEAILRAFEALPHGEARSEFIARHRQVLIKHGAITMLTAKKK